MAKKVIFKSQSLQIDAIQRFSQLIKTASTRELENELTAIIHSEILPLIDKGLSPVKKARNFKRYSQGYRDAIKRTKGLGKNKQQSPVNLRLSGEMLAEYKAKAKQEKSLTATMGIHSDASPRSKLLAGVHNNGENKFVPMRPFIPKQKEGETYTAKINAAIRRAFGYVLGRAINKGRGQR